MSPPPKLPDRVREAIRTRHYSRRTEEAYVYWIRRYIVLHGKAHPSTMGVAEISRFLTFLAVDQHVSASTQHQAHSALLFLYKHVLAMSTTGCAGAYARTVAGGAQPRRGRRAPQAAHRHGAAGGDAAYGAGLRLEECLELRVKDLDFDRQQIVVRQRKGRKDRVTMLPAAAREALTAHLARVRRMHEVDLARGLGRVVLPFAVARKYPNAATEWRWQFVFPATRICRDRRWGAPSRYRLHESVIQKAVASAVRQAGLTKRVGPHTMRHYALRRRCSKTGTTSARYRSCSGIGTSGRR